MDQSTLFPNPPVSLPGDTATPVAARSFIPASLSPVAPGARSATVDGEVFLGGNFIELGLSSLGDFGTLGSKPDGFFGTAVRDEIGMSVDRDGFDVGEDLRADIFLPGTPEETWVVGYVSDGSTFTGSNNAVLGRSVIQPNSVVDTSSGDTLSATSIGTFNSSLEIEQDISFEVDDKFFKNTVTLTNVSGEVLDDVRYMRSFDPDNTVDIEGSSGFSTINTIRGTIEEDGFAAVIAENINGDSDGLGDSPIFLYSNDPRARASYFGFTNTNPYVSDAYDAPPARGSSRTADIGITMTFDVDSLDPGESTTFTYFTSLDERSFDEVVDDLNQDPVAEDDSVTTDEDTSITFDVLSNDSDPDGDTISVEDFDTSGTLGLVTDNGDGTFSYDPNSAFEDLNDGETATDSFTYVISDGNDGVDSATVTININGVTDSEPVDVITQPLNPIAGTRRDDNLIGTDSDDEISGRRGNDGITGEAGNDVLLGQAGNDAIEGGAGTDFIDGGAGTDTAVYQFDPAGVVVDLEDSGSFGSATDGYGDSDSIVEIENIIGSDFGDVIEGNNSNNSLTGRDGNDNIFGEGGNDFLLGGVGADDLSGGTGNDSFVYLTPSEGGDFISDFEVGTDKITIITATFGGGLSAGSLSSAQFTLGSSATTGDQRFIFDDSTGDLFFDADGSGSASQQLIAGINTTGGSFGASDIQLL